MSTHSKSRKTHHGAQPQFIAFPVVDANGLIRIDMVNLNGGPSSTYTYRSSSGKVEEVEKLEDVEWIGEISLSPNLFHRTWIITKGFIKDSMGLPTTSKELIELIESRTGAKKQWWGIGGKKKVHYVSLPNLLTLTQAAESITFAKDAVYVSNVTIAPHRQRQGFGLLLHTLAASFLKQLGYKAMISDLVGLNTKGEVRVWQKMQKRLPVRPFKLRYDDSPLQLLLQQQVIDKTHLAFLEKKMGFHVNGKMTTLKQMTKTQFPQFELNLTDIPAIEFQPTLVEFTPDGVVLKIQEKTAAA